MSEISLTYVVVQLQSYLDELDRMTPLPEAGSPEALAEHPCWMEKHRAICRIAEWAQLTALVTVPPEVAEVLQAIQVRKMDLLNPEAL